jgi:GDP-mannose transporter
LGGIPHATSCNLSDVNAGMFTVLKNLTNLLALTGDYVLFGRTYGGAVWASMGLMIVSAVLGGVTDARFSAEGYFWQLLNCVFSAGWVGSGRVRHNSH